MFLKIKFSTPPSLVFESLPFTTLEINKKKWKQRYFKKTDILFLLKHYEVLDLSSEPHLRNYYLVSFKDDFFYISEDFCIQFNV
jgi:hypothetical protein